MASHTGSTSCTAVFEDRRECTCDEFIITRKKKGKCKTCGHSEERHTGRPSQPNTPYTIKDVVATYLKGRSTSGSGSGGLAIVSDVVARGEASSGFRPSAVGALDSPRRAGQSKRQVCSPYTSTDPDVVAYIIQRVLARAAHRRQAQRMQQRS